MVPKQYIPILVDSGRSAERTRLESFFCLVGIRDGETAYVTRFIKPTQGSFRVTWFLGKWVVVDKQVPENLESMVRDALRQLGRGMDGDQWSVVVREDCPRTAVADLHTHPWGTGLAGLQPSSLDLDVWRAASADKKYEGPYLHFILHPFYGKYRLSGWYFGPDGVRVLSHEDVTFVD